MTYDPEIHHRHSIRLKNYDYSHEGLYFITLVCQDRICRFGEISDGVMVLNEHGNIVLREWENTANIRKDDIRIHSYVIMPNHFHAIVEIRMGISHTDTKDICNVEGVYDTPLRSPSNTLGAIVRGFKSAVSRQLGFSTWQRNYYEHVIRDSGDYINISDYIATNPINWHKDSFNEINNKLL